MADQAVNSFNAPIPVGPSPATGAPRSRRRTAATPHRPAPSTTPATRRAAPPATATPVPRRTARPTPSPATTAKRQTKQVGATARGQANRVKATTAAQGKEVARTVQSDAQQLAGTVREQASQVKSELADQTRGLLDESRLKLQEQVDLEARRLAANLSQVGTQAVALASGRPEQAGPLADYLEQAATWIDTRASDLEERGVEGVVADVADFAGRRPAVFLLGAAALGFGVGRLVRSGALSSNGEEA